MTQKEKAKKDKFEKIKKSLFKFLHITGYICTVFIILIFIISCFQGCSSDRKKNSDSIISQPNQLINYSQNQQYYVFNFNLDDTIVIDLDTQRALLPYSQSGIYTFEGDFEFSSSTPQIVSFNVEYQEYYQSGTLILDVYFLDIENTKYRVVYKQDDEGPQAYQDFNYNTYYVDSVFYNGDTLIYDDLFLYFFSLDEGNNFTFNPTFNYNAPMGLNLAAQWGNGASFTQEYSDTAYIDYNVGLFVSNGQLYDFIRVTYFKTTAMSFYINDQVKSGPNGAWTYMFLGYGQSWNNNQWGIVNYRDMQNYEKNGAYGYYVLGTTTWKNDQYRYIKFLQPLSESNRIAIYAFNNNNVGSYSGSLNGNGNVFILLGSAFSELLPFLNIMILPNISIGVLLFLPLIVGIVVILFKILKK